MRIFQTFNFDKQAVSAMYLEEGATNYLWFAFNDNGDGTCDIRKTSVNNLNQIYFDIQDLDCDKVNDMDILGNYNFLAVDDTTYFAYRLLKTSPISTQYSMSIPSGMNEAPIKVINDGTYLYFLTPGTAFGENAKIVKVSSTLVFQETIDLGETNAIGLTLSGTDIWVVTSSSPSKLIRVYQGSGDIYLTDVTELL